MKEFFEQGKKVFTTASKKISQQLESSIELVSEVVNGLPLLVSLERSSKKAQIFDEKHYFVIPLYSSEAGLSLHTMRALPEHVPEINDLPKRRVFHFPNDHYEATLRTYMVKSATGLVYQNSDNSSLESLADDIDALDTKLTYGMLLIGSIAAIFNPLLGIGIAAKAVLPGVASLLNYYGLRPLGKKLNESQLKKQAKQAEQNVLKQFSEANTLKVNNPILRQLEHALNTQEMEYDPLVDPNLSFGNIPELEAGIHTSKGTENWQHLTETAIYHVYKDIVSDTTKHDAARLGPEDIRWLKLMFVGLEVA